MIPAIDIRPMDISAIDAAVAENDIAKAESVRAFARGATAEAARTLGREFYPFCFEFPLFLAATISHVRDEEARLLLVANLYEEHGELDATKIHPELFRRYLRAVDLVPAQCQSGELSVLGARAAQRVTDICRAGPAPRALAALYAIELLFGPVCEALGRGLESLHLPEEAMNFFVVHSGADVVHAAQLRRALANSIHDEASFRDALDVARDVSAMFYDLFDFIARPPARAARTAAPAYELDRAS